MDAIDRRLGVTVPGWTPPPRPDGAVLKGRYAALERLEAARHWEDLFAANRADDAIWDYLPYGPFADGASYRAWLEGMEGGADPFMYVIRNLETGRAEGVATYLRITPDAGTIEVGHINYSKALQRTRAATEAMFLMMQWAFEAGYRRYEWKCDALNLPSRRAAIRLGLSYEGIFRQATVVKGRNRDTAWFAAIDSEWPALKAAYEAWLDPANFDPEGRQRQSLTALTAPVIVMQDPAQG
jgi:RimJ/RimL family protein N-acetyltransferase